MRFIEVASVPYVKEQGENMKMRLFLEEKGFAEAPAQSMLRNEKNEKNIPICSLFSFFPVWAFSAPFLPIIFTPKKRGREIILVYFRFLNTKNAITTIAAMAATSTTATSVVMIDSVGSGVIGPEGEIAGSTCK